MSEIVNQGCSFMRYLSIGSFQNLSQNFEVPLNVVANQSDLDLDCWTFQNVQWS